MRKILCLILPILFLCSCATKSKSIKPVTRGIKFNAQISYYNEQYECDTTISPNGDTEIFFAGALQSSAVYWFVKQAVPLILSAKYDVSFWDSYRAVSALDVKRNEEELIFSTRNVGPVFKVFAAVFRDRLSLLREIAQ